MILLCGLQVLVQCQLSFINILYLFTRIHMTLPYPDLRFDLHPVRAKSVSWIELFYPCDHTGQILPNTPIRGVTYSGNRPVAFKWHNSQACKVTPQLIDWVFHSTSCGESSNHHSDQSLDCTIFEYLNRSRKVGF